MFEVFYCTQFFGFGLRATEDIEPDTTILIEKPVIVAFECSVFPKPVWNLVFQLVDQTCEPEWLENLQVFDKFEPTLEDIDELSIECIQKFTKRSRSHILRTHKKLVNHYTILSKRNSRNDDKSLEGAGFYQILHYINHSCDANCYLYKNDVNTKIELISDRFIRKGEELSYDYCHINIEHHHMTKYKLLHKIYGFYCRCELCQTHLSHQRKFKAISTRQLAHTNFEIGNF